ncbi:hypothetical protein HG547_04450 [Shewanella sp. DNRA4]|uniref:hypothetical protein n=1 Tax=Shewanella TaxID=22 RepID=UPI00146B5162|nr:hypothetical protein [Shewanella sp. DNRA4]NMD50881.1 hypothetical protein [Shewanella sp. DNRA4]
MLSKLLFGVLVFISFSCSSAQMGWSGKAKITKLYAVSDDWLLIKLSSSANPSECKTTADGDILIYPNTQKTFYNLLLAAHMAGREVDIFIIPPCGTTHWEGSSFSSVGHVIVY